MSKVESIKETRRKNTARVIQNAILSLQSSKAKVSISAVAKVADVSSALIHNTYPDLAEQIRAITGKTTRSQRDEKQVALVKARETNRSLRAENALLKADLSKLASVNQKLLTELATTRSMSNPKVVTIVRLKPGNFTEDKQR